jgi:hypothetical protein
MTTVATASPVGAVPRLWPGETVVVIGGGSSLTPDDVAFCRGKARVIAIKEAIELAPWADALYACDDKWWRFHAGYPAFTGLKFALEPQSVAWPGVQVLRNAGDDGLELDPTALRTGHNSGYQAVNLAVHLGVSKIVLLGFDMWRGPSGKQNWFDKPGLHVDSPYPLFLMRFASIVEPLKAAGVEVVNASRFTVLTAFPRVLLEEALS